MRLLLSGNDLTPALDAGYGNSPMSFEANQGQVDSRVSFISRGKGYELFLTSTEAVLSLAPAGGTTTGASASNVLSMELVGANTASPLTGTEGIAAKSNYLRGSDPSKWITNISSFARVDYQDVYPGIGLAFHGTGQKLEYDFTVAPGADPSAIRIRFQGDTGIELDAQGNLLLHSAMGDIVEHAPVLYQGAGADRQAVSGSYSIEDDGTVGFTIGPYDATRPLVIDPVMAYATYLGNGGALNDLTQGAAGGAVAVDADGNAYVTGAVWSSAFPKTIGSLQPAFVAAGYDAFVTKLNPAGQVVFSTYLGGNPDESGVHEVTEDGYTDIRGYQIASTSGEAIAVDSTGAIYVTGSTSAFDAGDFLKVIGFVPTVNAFQKQYGGGASDAFVAKLDPTGASLAYSSYFGGAELDVGSGIAVDAAGNAYMVGSTISGSYEQGLQADAFVVKIDATGSLAYQQSFGGGRTFTVGNAIAADAKGNVYFAGDTNDTELATPLAGPFGGSDLIVGRLNPDGGLVDLVRIGGERDDFAYGIALDAANDAYLTGTTLSLHFPTTDQAFQKEKPRSVNFVPNAFVTKLDPELAHVIYSTFLGGSTGVSVVVGGVTRTADFGDSGYAIAVDTTGAAYVVGRTASEDFPTANAVQLAHAPVPDTPADGNPAPHNDGFVAKLDPSGANLVYSTYLGGTGQDAALAVAVDGAGNAYVVGTTDSTNFPTTDGSLQPKFSRQPGIPFTSFPNAFWYQSSAFVARLAPRLQVIAQPVQAFIGQAFTGAVATFTTPDLSASGADFTANVNYGDGITDLNAIVTRDGGPGTPFSVFGNHTYTKLGAYPVVVTVTDNKHHETATTAYDASPYFGNQAETAIAVDPHNPKRLFAMSNDQLSIDRTGQTDIELGPSEAGTAAPGAGGGIFAAFSTDGGVTWIPSDARDHTIGDGNDGLPLALGDPNALFDSFGNLFLTYMTADGKGVAVAMSIDGGKKFTPLGDAFSDASGVDQPKLAIGPGDSPGTESLWITFEKDNPRTILVAAYRVLGLGAVDLLGDPFPVPGSADGLLSAVSVGPKGQALVSWENTSTDPLLGGHILVNTNPDGIGNRTNFAPQAVVVTEEILAGTLSRNLIPPQNRRGTDANPRIVWDLSHGPHAGRVYMSFVTPGPAGTNVKLLASDDDGANWTAFGVNPNGSPHSIQVNDSTATDYAFLPSIAVDPMSGDLALGWYDTRSDQAASKLTQFFTAISSDGGQTFSSNVPVSLGASDATITAAGNQYYDYSALAFYGGLLHPAWADNSFGKAPTTPLDIAAARIAVAHVSAAVPEVVGVTINLTEGQQFDGTVATFEDPDPALTSTDFSATINWGDGIDTSQDLVIITAVSDGNYVIRDSHHYATPGVYVLGIKVHDKVHDLYGGTVTNVSQSPGYQGETTIAIDPKDPTRLFVASNSSAAGLFSASSTDGGVNWVRRVLAAGVDVLPPANGDSKAVYDQFGNLFLAYLTEGRPHSVVIAVSQDNGQTFTTVDVLNDPDSVDQPSIAVGPDTSGQESSVWVTFQTGNNEIMAAHASVSGLGLVSLFSELQVASSPGSVASRNFGDIAIGPSGQALVAYEAPSTGPGPAGIFVNLDGGATQPESFGAPVLATTTNVGGFASIPSQTERLIDAEGNLAWDLSSSSHRGRVYLVYTDAPAVNAPETNVFLRYSDDSGRTWSDRVQVNGNDSGKSQFLPSIAVDPSNGDIAVSWYDSRNDANGVKAEYFVAISSNGGLTFSPSMTVSLGASDATDPGLDLAGQRSQFGDYSAVALQNGIVYPAWTDNSPELNLNPDRPQFDIAVARAPTVHVADAPLSATALDISTDVGAEGELFSADVASFSDADPNANLSLYTATIDWGDNSKPQPGNIRSDNGKFIVSGDHAYKEEGSYTITVTIDDQGGASAKVTLDTDVEDGKLTAVGPTFKPAEALSFNGVVATFTDDNHNAKPGDYFTPTINWGDGSVTDGTIVFDGTAALTAWSGHSGFLAIGNAASGDRSLVALDGITSKTTALMPLSANFYGGLAEGPQSQLFALSNNGAGQSFLNLLNVNAQTSQPLAYLGSGFTGGMAFDAGDGKLYAIVNATDSSTLYAIDAKTYAAQPVGSIETHAYAGLAYAGNQTFYATASDADGKSKLYRIHVGAGLDFSTVNITLGSGFTGGLAESVHYVGAPNPFGLLDGLVGLSSRGDGSAFLNAISLIQSAVTPAYEIPNFNNGFAVVGAHAYAVKGNQTVTVEIRDVGGSAAIATSTAAVIDEPPVALPAPPAMSAFQGFATGPLALGSFSVPHGAEAGPNQYTAAIDWGDGSNPESALSVVSGATITISSAGHTYTQTGASQPGAKTGEYHPIVTLSDDTGNSATVIDTVHVAPDVTRQVQVVGLGGPLNPATQFFTSSGTITNLSAATIPGPLYLIVHGLPAGVTLANASGTMFSGEPFYVANVSQLNAGQTFAAVSLQFRDPGLLPFTYSVTVIDGLPPGVEPAGTIAANSTQTVGFVANEGQTDAQALFLSQGDGYMLFLTADGAALSLLKPGDSGAQAPSTVSLGLEFVGANPAAEPVGVDRLATSTNYLIGDNPSNWRSQVASFGAVEYRDIYPGITLDYHSTTSQRIEYDFTVAAGADPGLIQLDIQGADSITLDGGGNLVLHTAAGDVVEQAPVMYQQLGGARQAVAGAYEIAASGQVSFRIGDYDRSRPLIIDPVLVHSTYLGGSSLDVGQSVATDAAGNVYLTGTTYSPDFPTLGALAPAPDRVGQPSLHGGPVAYVTKLDPTGAIVYSTYLGGSGLLVNFFGIIIHEGEAANGIAIDSAGEAYITGSTYSLDFPTVNALTSEADFAGSSNGFVAKLSADGSSLLFSTYLTGTHEGSGIALDPDGNAYIAGIIGGSFPLSAGAAQTQVAGGFVEKMSAAGDRVLYAAAVPGTASETGLITGTVKGIAVDAAGEAYVVGDAYSGGGPVLGAAQPVYGGGASDVFVAKLNAAGSGLVYWSYLGGNDSDHGNAIAIDAAGAAYIAGSTMSADFKTAQAVQASFGGTTADRVAVDAFVTKLSPDGSTFVYSTYLGGSGPDRATGIAVDGAGNAYVTGQTGSANFPIKQALQPTFRGDGRPETAAVDSFDLGSGRGDAFVTRLNASGTALDYSTYLGGGGFDAGNAIAVSPAGDAVITGATTSLDFPTLNALQTQPGILSGTTTVQNEVGASFIVPASSVGRSGLQIPTAFVTRIAAQGPGTLQLANVGFQPTEGVAFTGIVASFTDTDTDTAASYAATIDWGDGTVSAGVVASDNAHGFGFVVNGVHTYSEEGPYPVVVTLRDADGSIAAASQTTFGQTAGGPVTYHISVDTSALAGTTGFLDLQFNPGALPQAQSAGATVGNFQTIGGALGNSTHSGDASGALDSSAMLLNNAILNELKQGFTFGDSLSFDLRLDGDALSLPARGLFGSTFALMFLGADGSTPLETTAADGAALRIGLYPDGSTRVVAADLHATAAAVNAVTVADAPLAAALVPIQAVEGTPFAGTVASFTDANTGATATDFTASVLWGDGSAATEGTIVADGNAGFHVTGAHTYVEAGSFAIQVVVRDRGGRVVSAVGANSTKTLVSGLQAPRVALGDTGTSGQPISFASGDFNGDGKQDLAVWHYAQAGPQFATLDVLLGNGDGSFQNPMTIVSKASPNSSLLPIALADFNGDGKLDVATNDVAYLSNGDGTFQAGKAYDGLAPNVALAVADFNGDGKTDLAVVNGFGLNGPNPGVHILLGNGDGTFASGTTYFDASVSTGISLVTGDFNGDGKPDLVFSAQIGGITVLFLNRGDGVFDQNLPVATGFTVSAAADLNGDGKLDLVGTGSGRVQVLFGKGNGAFSEPSSYLAGEQPSLVTVGDFNGDGIPDLAVDDAGRSGIGAGVSILKGIGDGTFAASFTFPTTGFLSGGGGIGTNNFSAADFNGDGSLDVVIRTPTTVSILFGQGDGSLVDDQFSPGGESAVLVAAGDFNGDGHIDVALATGFVTFGPNVLAGNGDGSFQTAGAYPAASLGLALLSADFNGDGFPDVISGNQLLLGRGDGTYLPAVDLNLGPWLPAALGDFNHDGHPDLVTDSYDFHTGADTVGVFLGGGDGTIHFAGSFTGSERDASLAVADMNGDGIADVVIGRDFSVAVLLGNADGSLRAPLIYPIANQSSFRIAIGDFNGDGKPDVAAASGGVNILLGNGDGSLQSPTNYDPGFSAYSMAMGDFNGDGKLDLIGRLSLASGGAVRVLFGNGDGSFAGGVTISTGIGFSSFAIVTGDFNGDGRTDFAVGGDQLLVVLGNGDGTFQAGLGYASAGANPSTGTAGLTAADVNHDGRTDLLAADVNVVSVFLGQPSGVLVGARSYLHLTRTVQSADLNGDGRPDLVGIEQKLVGSSDFADEIYVALNGGDGTFPKFVEYDLRRPNEQDQRAFILGLVMGDFNGDGIVDLAANVDLPFAGFRRAVLLGNGDGTFRAPQLSDISSVSGSTLVGKLVARDLNGDGKLDLINFAADFSTGDYLEVNLGNGDGTFQSTISTGPLANVNLSGYASSLAAEGFAMADFNGDGKLDAAVGTVDHSISIYPGNGDGTFAAPITSAANLWTTAFAAGDLNGDGKADLVTANVDATVSLLTGKGDGTFEKPLTYLADWSVGGGGSSIANDPLSLADLNGDGVLDVIVGAQSRVAALLNQPPVAPQKNVADALLLATSLDHTATQAAPLTAIVARFTDANPLATLDDFSATIAWGDGHTSAGVIQSDLHGGFFVMATNTYAQAGAYSATIAIVDRDGSAVTVLSAITVGASPDLALTAVSAPVGATAQVQFSGVVASFTDADPSGSAQDFSATIDWGDGHTSPGFVEAVAGGFEVIGANTYANPGNYATQVTIVDTGGATASINGTATVAANGDAPLTPTSVTFHATEQTTFSGLVASFTDADPNGQAADYSASIDWGDGTRSLGTVSADASTPGQFDVLATHGYLIAGSYSVTVNLSDREGATAVAISTAVIEDAPLTANTRRVTATEGLAFSGLIASFVDSNPFSTANDFTAAIAWGDGQVSIGVVTADRLIPGRFDVTGVHTYAEVGIFPVDVSYADRGGAAVSARSVASVTDAPLLAAGATMQAAEGVAFTTVVATFSDRNPGGSADEYTAIIVWGDGRTSPGAVTQNNAGGFDVSATHAYAVAGTYTTRVSILDRGGASVVAEGIANVAGATVTGTGQTIRTTEGAPFAGQIASFFSSGAARGPNDFVAAIDWGDGRTSTGIIAANQNTGGFDVFGNSTYAEEGGVYGYSITITIADRSGDVATLNATARVDDAPLTAAAVTVQTIQGAPFTGVLTTFTDADPAAAAGDYIVYIFSGTQFVFGTVTADAQVPGQFDVRGALAFADLGAFPVTVSVYDRGGANAVVNSTVEVVMVPSANGTSSQANAGVSFNTVVATIEDRNSGDQPGDFAATIDWGDGHQSRGLVTIDTANAGQFLVLGSSTYAQAGSYPVAVDLVRRDGLPLSAASTIDVSAAPDAPLFALPGIPISARANLPVSTRVALFRDADLSATAADFNVTINWGDDTSSAGVVSQVVAAPGQFAIFGSHTYATAGGKIVTVQINDVAGASATANTAAVASVDTSSLLLTNAGLSLAEGASATITSALLAASNPSSLTAPTDLVFTLNSAPTHGTLLLNGQPLNQGGVFTQDDINQGRLAYQAMAEGPDTFAFSVAVAATGQAASAEFAMTISDPSVIGNGGFTYLATLGGAPASQTVATFSDPGGAEALSSYSAEIDWGDGATTAAAAITLDAETHVFTVSGQHAYAEAGIKTITVTIHDVGGSQATAASRAIVSSASAESISGAGIKLDGCERLPLNDVAVATFISSNAAEPVSAFAATIHWGDGAISPGTISGSGPSFTVSGSHTYLDEGLFAVTLTVADASESITISTKAAILEELLAEGTHGTADQRFIDEVYRDVLGRAAEPQGRDFWVAMLNRVHSRAAVVEAIEAAVTDEYHRELVAAEFQHYLHRQAEPAALRAFSDLLAAGGTAEQLDAILVSSPEYVGAHTVGSNDGFLDGLYADSLHRQVDEAARSFYDDLFAHAASRAQIADIVFASDEYRRNLVDAWYEHYLDRPAEAAAQALFFHQLKAGLSDEQVIAQLLASDEFYAKTA